MKYVSFLFILMLFFSGCEEFSVKNIKCSETDKCPNGYFCNSFDKCVTNCSEDSECRNGFKCDLEAENHVCKEFCDSELGGCADGFYCFENKCITCNENQKYSYFHKKCMNDCNEGEANGKEKYENGVCVCDIGYLNDYHCPDIDECDVNQNACGNGYNCKNSEGFFSCLNIDECKNNTHNCNENANCTDSDGLFTCECKTGYSGNGVDCEDIDECENNSHNCETGFECVNTEGSFNCVDINECLTETHTCELWESCINTSGSFVCSNINECQNETHNCSENAVCIDISNEYKCECKQGYEGDGFNCTDINECENNSDNCSETENCVNIESSFDCVCKSGYEKNGAECEDVNECQQNSHNCTNGYECENTTGSFICNDINECLNGSDNCPIGYECENIPASFECNEYCGNGTITTSESCDGSNLNNNTCISRNYSAGNLTCSDECQFITTDCRKTFMVGTEFNDYSSGIAFDSNGNLYVVGTTEGGINGNTHLGDKDVFIMKYNTNNVLEWTKQFGTSQTDSGEDVIVDNLGNIYIVGFTSGTFENNISKGGVDIFVAKYSSSGQKLWINQYGTTATDDAYSIKYKNDYLYITGSTGGVFSGNTNNMGSNDIFVGKISSLYGQEIWFKQTGSAKSDRGNSLVLDVENNIYLTGFTQGNLNENINNCSIDCTTPKSFFDVFLIKYNSSGDLVWTRQIGTEGQENSYGIDIDNLNNIYITGNTNGNFEGNTNNCINNCTDSNYISDVFLAKYDSFGNKIWIKQFGTDKNDVGTSIFLDSNKNIYLAGKTNSFFNGFLNACLDNCLSMYDIFLVKFDNLGNQEFIKQWGTSLNDINKAIKLTNTKIFTIGNTTGDLDGNTNSGNADIFVTSFEIQ